MSSPPEEQGRSVPEFVALRAAETPSAPAVVAGDRILSYEELDTRANRLAAELRFLGVGAEVIVGLRADRSPEMIIGALAILKAGGAYLPIDPSYPADRQAYMLADAGCRVSITAEDIAVDRGTSAGPPDAHPRPEHLAYVIYTSGSTGAPKGVEVTHSALMNLVRWHHRAFDVRPADRASHLSSVGFDAAVWEIWSHLTAGASVHLPDDATRSDPEALRDWLCAHQITIAFVPTPMAERLMGLPWPMENWLRTMLTGADVLHRYPSSSLPFLLVNNYGPTEATVVATSGPVFPDEPRDGRPSIGHPIDNAWVHILDGDMREVPDGTAGELYIGGAGLARGYVNRPEWTAERFIHSPFEPGARFYRTGDVAARRPDGRISFLGRVDDQLKIRGFRIEPNEIVAALDRDPEVAASAVAARDNGRGERILVAYVVPVPGCRPNPTLLREALQIHLPEYMIPAVFVGLDALPVSRNGKLDRPALPEPDEQNTLTDGYVAPRTPVEVRVAGLMAQLLDVERVSVEDNFFLLGGHSLLGAQLCARIRDVFSVEMSLRGLFDAPSVARLSAEIERLLTEKVDAMTEEAAEVLLAERDNG